MYTNFASATLIVLGVVIAILGFILGGSLLAVWAVSPHEGIGEGSGTSASTSVTP